MPRQELLHLKLALQDKALLCIWNEECMDLSENKQPLHADDPTQENETLQAGLRSASTVIFQLPVTLRESFPYGLHRSWASSTATR